MKLSSLSVILADDDKDDCFLFNEAIAELSLPISLTIVHNGEELMERLTTTAIDLPDVIFLDLNMPRKNGFEVLAEISINKNLKIIPIIIFSTSFNNKIVDQLYGGGAHHYMRKPTDFSKFKKILHTVFTSLTVATNSQPPREDFVLTR